MSKKKDKLEDIDNGGMIFWILILVIWLSWDTWKVSDITKRFSSKKAVAAPQTDSSDKSIDMIIRTKHGAHRLVCHDLKESSTCTLEQADLRNTSN